MTVGERRPRTVEPLHRMAEVDLEDLIESTMVLERELVTHETVCRRILADVRNDVPIGCVLPAVHADQWRSALTEAIKRFEQTRHRARLVLVSMSLDEGMSIAEIARSWGVSRQLASRWVHEATAQPGPGEPPGTGPPAGAYLA